ARLKDWYGEPDQGYQLFAPLIHSAWENDPSAAGYLLQLAMDETQPAIARATAMSLWAPGSNRAGMLRLQQILNDDDPLVRLGALEAASQLPVQQRIIAFPLVWDELLAVRTQAARLMASYPESQIPEKHREQLRTVLDEYIATQAFSAERPESQLNLASLYNDLGQQDKAEAAFKQALVLQPQFVPAYVNYAHMLGRAGREKNAEQILQKGIRKVPGSAPLWHALGLSQVRNGSTADALISLKKAATLDSDDSRYAYVYAVALHSTGKIEASIKALEAAIALHPSNIEILMALVNYNRQSEQYSQALKYVKKLETLLPGHEQVKALRVEIESLAKQPIQ
ncbi:MAG: tetratricopeptide repeat protein, partial [bacterium]